MNAVDVVPTVLCNGSVVASEQQAMAFGDGVFTTILVCRGYAHLFDRHCDRLQRGMYRLGIDLDIQCVRDDFSALCEILNPHLTYRVRFTVARVGHYAGYATDQCEILRHVVALPYDIDQRPDNVSLAVSSVRLARQPLLAGIKHCSRLEQILAKREIHTQTAGEALMLDDCGNVVEAIAANIVVLKGNLLLTPVLDHCGVHGVMRDFLFQQIAPQLALETQELSISMDDVLNCEGLALTNALTGLQLVSSLDMANATDMLSSGNSLSLDGTYIKRWPRHAILERCQASIHRAMSGSEA